MSMRFMLADDSYVDVLLGHEDLAMSNLSLHCQYKSHDSRQSNVTGVRNTLSEEAVT